MQFVVAFEGVSFMTENLFSIHSLKMNEKGSSLHLFKSDDDSLKTTSMTEKF